MSKEYPGVQGGVAMVQMLLRYPKACSIPQIKESPSFLDTQQVAVNNMLVCSFGGLVG